MPLSGANDLFERAPRTSCEIDMPHGTATRVRLTALPFMTQMPGSLFD